MTKEDLFLAIGSLEEDRLARTEIHSASAEKWEDKTMKPARTIGNVLIAAAIIGMLAATAFAVGGYLIYDTPEAMITAIFGDQTGYDHKEITTWTDPEKPGAVYENPAYDRVPADETVVQEDVVPHVSPVGRSLMQDGYTLTVDAYMYDSTTHSGIVTYTLEAENGLPEYALQPDGELWYPDMPDPVEFSQYGKPYIIQEKTTEDKLTVVYYFYYDSTHSDTFTAALGDYTDMTDEERNALGMECRKEVRKSYAPEEAVRKASEALGQRKFEKRSTNSGDADSAYFVVANELYMQKLAEMETLQGVTAEQAEALFQQCEAEARKLYTAQTVIQKAEEAYAYDYLANELYFEQADQREKITFDCSESRKLDSVTLAEGKVIITPISIQIDMEDMEFLHEQREGMVYVHADNIDSVVIRYSNGSEYPVDGKDFKNVAWGLTSIPKDSGTGYYTQLNYMFNRIVDVEKVSAIVINETELPVD